MITAYFTKTEDTFQSLTPVIKIVISSHIDRAPYNAIHVGAAAATFPKNLMAQLAVGGVMVIPVGPDGGVQYLYRVERVGDDGGIVGIGGGDSKIGFLEEDFKVYRVLGVRYVPLVRTDD